MPAFLATARPAVAGDLADWAGTLGALESGDESGRVYATATVGFRGGRRRYRRALWPPNHPPELTADLPATVLTERLLTRRPIAAADDAVMTSERHRHLNRQPAAD